jgi:hypothetical protein
MEWKDRLNAEISQSGTNYQSFRRNLKFCLLRFAGFVLTRKLACATFGVQNGVVGQFKRRDISFRNELIDFSSKFESLTFAICRYCFDAEIAVRDVRRVEWSGKNV